MNREILEENIYYYKNVIADPKKFVEIIEATENEDYGTSLTKWKDWTACSGEMYLYGSEKTVMPSEIEKGKSANDNPVSYIYHTISDIFYNVCKDYALSHGDTEEPIILPAFDIKKYSAGTFMGAHFDQQEGDERLKYSLVMYLNDDYEGGELYVPAIGLSIKPRANSLVLWSHVWHEDMAHGVRPIISGTRFMSQGFFWSV